jgi:hypothetical protein
VAARAGGGPGDVATIESPIRKLSLGEVKVLDTDGTVLR